MSPEEREQWENLLIHSNRSEDVHIIAILDRVEELERHLDGARNTLTLKTEALRVALAELAAVQEAYAGEVSPDDRRRG